MIGGEWGVLGHVGHNIVRLRAGSRVGNKMLRNICLPGCCKHPGWSFASTQAWPHGAANTFTSTLALHFWEVAVVLCRGFFFLWISFAVRHWIIVTCSYITLEIPDAIFVLVAIAFMIVLRLTLTASCKWGKTLGQSSLCSKKYSAYNFHNKKPSKTRRYPCHFFFSNSTLATLSWQL